jgi:hypothetical protein
MNPIFPNARLTHIHHISERANNLLKVVNFLICQSVTTENLHLMQLALLSQQHSPIRHQKIINANAIFQKREAECAME